MRVIHRAPELGSPELTVDGKQAGKSLSYRQATPYLALPAGLHTLDAMRSGDSTALVASAHEGGRRHRVLGDRARYPRPARARGNARRPRRAPLVRQPSAHAATGSGRASAQSGSVTVRAGDSL
ncbi:MAG: hypothetical protein ACR2NR_23820 [Solirubrobacteraceae bacterium]